jgi:hypothetical protein
VDQCVSANLLRPFVMSAFAFPGNHSQHAECRRTANPVCYNATALNVWRSDVSLSVIPNGRVVATKWAPRTA